MGCSIQENLLKGVILSTQGSQIAKSAKIFRSLQHKNSCSRCKILDYPIQACLLKGVTLLTQGSQIAKSTQFLGVCIVRFHVQDVDVYTSLQFLST